MSVLADNPFDEVSVDFAHVSGETLLLVIDDYSRFPFVEQVSFTSASAVIPKLDQLFATFGTPRIVKSDNGPPLMATNLQHSLKYLDSGITRSRHFRREPVVK